MRRSSLPHLAFCLAVAFSGLEVRAARAAPFDFFFAEPPHARGYQPARRRARKATIESVPAREQAATVPLPVPRPRFPSDPAEPPPTAPAGTADATRSNAPLPPPRPDDVGPKDLAPKGLAPKGLAPKDVGPNDVGPKDVSSGPAEHASKPDAPATSKGAAAPTQAEKSTAQPALPAKSPPNPPPSPASPPPSPATAASGATLTVSPRSPADDPSCLGRLKARNVAVEAIAIGPQPDARCTVVEAVKLSSLVLPGGETVDFPDGPTLACTTADAFSLYVRDLLVPLGKGTFGSPVASVWTGPGLECRSRDHIFGAKLSAHGQGLAVDIAQLKLADGRTIAVGAPKTDSETGFETAARAGGCGYFHTVLGPGSDSYHRTHWHLDLEVRGAQGDSKYCK